MQSDDEEFNDTVESLSPERKTQGPDNHFSLRRTPSRFASEKKRMDSKLKTLLGNLTPHSEETSSAGPFSIGISSSFNYETADPKVKPILKKNYTPREKADRIQEMEHEETQVEVEFPNPLSDICRSDNMEEEQLIDIPFAKGKTQEEETHIENCIKVNNLKQKRASLYGSITKGEKTLMRSDQIEWTIIQARTRESFNTLTRIMDNLQMIGFDRTPGEAAKYLNFSSRLKKMMTKVDHIMETLQVNIPGMVETLLEKYVQEEDDFCKTLINPSSRRSRSGQTSDATIQDLQQAQDEDDKRRKYAADHQAKLYFNARMSNYKMTSAGASSMPSLTKRPDSTRTHGASAQAGSQQSANAQAGAQFAGQPPPFFPNPPPPMPPYMPPPQQHYGAQAAAGYPMRPQANYQGIPKIKVPTFDEKPSEFQRFKLTIPCGVRQHESPSETSRVGFENQTPHNHFRVHENVYR